jgi:hypothetical protein
MEVFGDGQANAAGSASDEYAFGHVTKSRLFEKFQPILLAAVE